MKDDELKKYGKMIARVRHAKGISQRDLAEASGITPANIAKIELGKYNPGLIITLRLEESLKLNKIYLNENNIMVTDSNSNVLNFTLGATNPVAFYEAIKGLPCFDIINLSKDKDLINIVWNKDYEHVQFPDPLDELCYILSEEKIDWEMGSDEDHIGENYFWENIDITGREDMAEYIHFMEPSEFAD